MSVKAAWCDEPDPFLPALTVYELEDATDTGLLDADGNKIVRRRGPIGFDLNQRETNQ